VIAGAARKGVALHACCPMCQRCTTPVGVVHCSSRELQAAAAAGEAAALAAHQHSSRGLLLAFNSSAGPSATSGAAAAHAEALAWHWQGSAGRRRARGGLRLLGHTAANEAPGCIHSSSPAICLPPAMLVLRRACDTEGAAQSVCTLKQADGAACRQPPAACYHVEGR
jgi:hypothetical protein